MPEAVVNQLEQKRFVITPESLKAMKRVRDALPGLQEQYPYLSGVGFFGSRTKGKEHEGSDLDLRIFYDTSKSRDLTSTLGGISPAVPHVRKESKYELAGKIARIAGLSLDTQHDGWAVDISKERTDKYIEIFKEVASEYIDKDLTDVQIRDIGSIPPAQNLYSQSFLAVGEGVYQNRKYIIDQFKSMPQGEKYFQILMKCLGAFERGGNSHKYSTPAFKGLPKTLEEAEKYFLIKPNFLEENPALAA